MVCSYKKLVVHQDSHIFSNVFLDHIQHMPNHDLLISIAELSTGHFSWTRPDPTRGNVDPTRPDPTREFRQKV